MICLFPLFIKPACKPKKEATIHPTKKCIPAVEIKKVGYMNQRTRLNQAQDPTVDIIFTLLSLLQEEKVKIQNLKLYHHLGNFRV